MGIVMLNRVLISALSDEFEYLQAHAAEVIPQIFDVNLYSQTEVTKLVTFFTNNSIPVLAGYPVEGMVAPSVYVSPGEVSPERELLNELSVALTTQAPNRTSTEGYLTKKTCRIVVASEHSQIADLIGQICYYFLMKGRDSLEGAELYNPQISMPELDPLNKFFPQTFFYRTVMASFGVLDTFTFTETLGIIRHVSVGVTD